ncbi:serine family amino acid catabolism- protein [Drepanopeziza brunnea f. sp. 'multigermtubi' MB_m1]|uniref:L-serine ammonia-lyase n=1 Tax=Marssonina brunnea f. sp. multigermtubi (strain MB_m1) TaxID=1072389 RepID=K1WP56_MARBU|nr:serine family amino acid catabolism- protein [Drepanopeziza brunnea f. sp. 'multigermtubi' MB_m1]EKD14107.1 serine family amino acid catabolism- protein [Drepanopeziza brunnea f. sp. 'multigermtubi' MB_m1]
MTRYPESAPQPWLKTPCVKSVSLSRAAGCNVYLKLETLQPSGSFKSRGIGNLLRNAIATHGPSKPIHFYCSSGGNAGLACVVAATTLKRPATIVVPLSTTPLMIEKLRALGADVVQTGEHWSEADAYLREVLLDKDEHGVYVPPFDHEDIWAGAATIIDELEEDDQMGKLGYDAVVCSVGGGGLFCGIMHGLEHHQRLAAGVRVLAVETKGADSLNLSVQSRKLTRLPGITSIASSLGATQVASQAFTWAMRGEEEEAEEGVTSHVLSDAEAAMACVNFADDERILVEPACGASIAPAYSDTLHALLFPSLSPEEFSQKNIVIVVCGGSNVTLQILQAYQERYGQDHAVLEKFHSRSRARGQGAAEEALPTTATATARRDLEGTPVLSRPATGTMDPAEVQRQVQKFGKVLLAAAKDA